MLGIYNFLSKIFNILDVCLEKEGSMTNAAFTLITIRPRLVSWCSSWTNRDYRIQYYQIVSHLDVNRDNRANRGAKNFATITTIGGTIVAIASDRMIS